MCLENADTFTHIHYDKAVNGMSLYRNFLVNTLCYNSRHFLISGRCSPTHREGNPFTLTLKVMEKPLGAIWGLVS